MPMDWRTAYLMQARSDYTILLRLLQEKEVPLCHCLHYLQMTTEKLAKGFLTQSNGLRYPRTHNAFATFVKIAVYRPDIQQACGFTRNRPFIAYLESLRPLAYAIENLSPEGDDHPNPEYPWEQRGDIHAPFEYPFLELDLRQQSVKMSKLLQFIADCFTLVLEDTS